MKSISIIDKNRGIWIYDAGKIDVKIIASKKIIDLMEDDVFSQVRDVANTPGVVDIVLTPDAHAGYFCPIGCVAITENTIMPGAVGVDIGCGMRLLLTSIEVGDLGRGNIELIVREIVRRVPTGFDTNSYELGVNEFERIIGGGIKAVADSYEVLHSEHGGFDIDKKTIKRIKKLIGEKAYHRARSQIGTLGGGNHFIEMQEVIDTDGDIANKWGLYRGQLVVMIHSGSRNYGLQIANNYIKLLREYIEGSGKASLLANKNGVFANVDKEGSEYMLAMQSAINFASVNRYEIANRVVESFRSIIGNIEIKTLYDISHNIAAVEYIDGKRYIVHRKGATRALPAGHRSLHNTIWYDTGHPVILPGSMGSNSKIMVGTVDSRLSYYSINHGCGRVMSRNRAFDSIRDDEVKRALKDIVLNVNNISYIKDEAPMAYKSIDDVSKAVISAGIAKEIATLKPLAVIKGVEKIKRRRKNRRKRK